MIIVFSIDYYGLLGFNQCHNFQQDDLQHILKHSPLCSIIFIHINYPILSSLRAKIVMILNPNKVTHLTGSVQCAL